MVDDSRLDEAIATAYEQHVQLRKKHDSILRQDEEAQVKALQQSYVNFYDTETVNPYIPLAAKGPWIVTSCGAVIHDSGGYGMLGFGHAPSQITEALNCHDHVMANIMTAHFRQYELGQLLAKEIGHRRSGEHKKTYDRYICLNSGSESVTMALRISDILAGQTDVKSIKYVSLQGGFHGRTDFPAQMSDSCLAKYQKHLATYRHRDNLITVAPNNCTALQAAFDQAKSDGVYIAAMLMEPVMGEGNPGMAISPEFYQLARQLTKDHQSLLVVDSIQAGIRARGCLSIVDYPGFETLESPDCETYSKALNAGQFPLSILALNKKAADLYVTGMYGNTMTTNPRALGVATAVLESISDDLRANICGRGREFIEKSQELKKEFPSIIESVQGTGLLFAIEINKKVADVVGSDGLEMRLRKRGIGVIHGGQNALRFTPVFDITSKEVDLILAKVREVLRELA